MLPELNRGMAATVGDGRMILTGMELTAVLPWIPMHEPSEQEIQRSCLEWLWANRVMAWKCHNGGVFDPNRRQFYFAGRRGVSDILGVLPGGRFLACEVKRPKGRMTPDQEEFQRDVAEAGGVACCVHSVQELEDDLKPYISPVQPRLGFPQSPS